MKKLFLVRHAKAESRATSSEDFDRTLVKKGRADSYDVAHQLKKEGIVFDSIISSPAPRALETAVIFAKELGFPKKNIIKEQMIYDSLNAEDFVKVMDAIDSQFNNVLFVGHNPAISEFANFLLKEDFIDLPKTGVIVIEFDRKTWKQLRKNSGSMKYYFAPLKKEIKKEILSKRRQELNDQLTEAIAAILNKCDLKAAKKMKNSIKQASKDLSKEFIAVRKSTALTSYQEVLEFVSQVDSATSEKNNDLQEVNEKEKHADGNFDKNEIEKIKIIDKSEVIPETDILGGESSSAKPKKSSAKNAITKKGNKQK